MENDFIVNDDFLSQQDFETIRNEITTTEFQWSFSQYVDSPNEEPTPGQFVHTAYYGSAPCSDFYNQLAPILERRLNCCCLYRIKLNLQPRLPEPFTYMFHSDLSHDFEEDVASHWTTAILYINTNNGYTEFENGEKVNSVANRLMIFDGLEKSTGKVYDTPCHKIMKHEVLLPNTDWVSENHWCVPLYYHPEVELY